MTIQLKQLLAIMPQLPVWKANEYLPHLNAAMEEFEINNIKRQAAFLAQLAHESCQLRFFQEIWGSTPTPAQKGYEGRKDLGNVHPGDGYRFRGRGPIQLTGRHNYTKFGKMLGVDLVNYPDIAATPKTGFRIAGLYWKDRNLNALADAGNFEEITRRINGGFNGATARRNYYQTALRVLQGVPA